MKPTPSMRADRLLMFGIMLIAAIGNTGLQSILPAIGRTIGLPDPLIALAFSLSALLWTVSAPFWSRRIDDRRAKTMVMIGMAGFTVSLLLCGIALTAGVAGWIAPMTAFALFVVGRSVYGCFGSAAPSAAQALVVASTPREDRTSSLTLLASAFGLGTIVGPALAPFFILPFVGLAGPAFVFAAIGVAMMIFIHLRLTVGGVHVAHAWPASEPGLGFEPVNALPSREGHADQGVRFFDPRIRAWMIFGLTSSHAQAIIGQTMAFLVIDRLRIEPLAAQPLIGLVLTVGAGATLLAQWGVMPRLRLQPRAMVLWGTALSASGALMIALAHDLHMLAIAFATASLGFGLLRPGFSSGASLAVGEDEQAAVAGYVTANNGAAFVAGPAVGILLYEVARPLPYLACTGMLIVLLLYGLRALHADQA